MEKHALGVRKGAWTKEEDILLRKCIEKYGEGRWHLVPLRAGLNRCRKSCRLRWLNYLRPNIKRGYFTKDEVDLIVRLHKLLGNRWSLIAGRIPGRTANDVKNFWNTHMDKKSSSAGREIKCRRRKNTLSITESNIIRPRPRTFSQKQQAPAATFPREKKSLITQTLNDEENRQPSNPIVSENESTYKQAPSDQLVPEEVDECMRWWGNLLEINENENGAVPFLFPEDDQDHDSVMDPMMIISSPGELNNDAVGDDGMSSLDLDDVDVWQLVGMDMQ